MCDLGITVGKVQELSDNQRKMPTVLLGLRITRDLFDAFRRANLEVGHGVLTPHPPPPTPRRNHKWLYASTDSLREPVFSRGWSVRLSEGSKINIVRTPPPPEFSRSAHALNLEMRTLAFFVHVNCPFLSVLLHYLSRGMRFPTI